MSGPVIVVVTADPGDALRVAGALGVLDRHLRAAGQRLPDSLRGIAVVHACAAPSRPEATRLGGSGEPVDDAAVPLLWDYRQVADRLGGVSERTVQRLVASGRLPVRRLGRRSLIAPADVEAYVATLSSETA